MWALKNKETGELWTIHHSRNIMIFPYKKEAESWRKRFLCYSSRYVTVRVKVVEDAN